MKKHLPILRFFKAHKILGAALIIVLAGGGYYAYGALTKKGAETRYVLGTVEKGAVIVSLSGSGQVSASNQVDIKPKVGGDIVKVSVVNGQEVKAGDVLFRIDARDAEKSVRDAEANLRSAEIAHEKLLQPADALALTQSENTLARATESRAEAVDNLKKAYDDGFNNVANAFLDLPAVMTGMQDTLYSSSPSLGGSGQWNIDYYAGAIEQYNPLAMQYRSDTNTKFSAARVSYDTTFAEYKRVTRLSDTASLEALIDHAYETTRSIADAVKSANNLIQLYKDELTQRNAPRSSLADTHLASLNSYTGMTNSHLLSLLSVRTTIRTSKEAIVNADRSIAENTESLRKLKAGADALDIASSELSVQQRRNALLDAREKLADYYVRAPFDGTVAKLNVAAGDAVTSGTAAVTFITKQQIAEISMNEVDAAILKPGQKATLTFDAIEGLTITGRVKEVDAVGTVTQGVVTYAAKIVFDAQDARVKSGMSVSASIVTDIRQDVLTVPNGAIETQGTISYVKVFDKEPAASTDGVQGVVSAIPPRMQEVTLGLSNDTITEIISGLAEGTIIVTRTVAPTAATAQSAPSLFGGGGGVRIR